MTFDELHAVAKAQAIDPSPDHHEGVAAQVVSGVLFDWIAANVDDQDRKAIATLVCKALLGIIR